MNRTTHTLGIGRNSDLILDRCCPQYPVYPSPKFKEKILINVDSKFDYDNLLEAKGNVLT